MNQLITPQQANIYYGRISDNIVKYNERSTQQIASSNMPLMVDQLFRLRPIFQKVITDIQLDNLNSKATPGQKLRAIFEAYQPSRNISRFVFNALTHCNEATHYEENKIEKSLTDFKDSVRSLAEFISEYSGVQIPDRVKKFYWRDNQPVQNKPSQTVPKKVDAPVITDREKYLGTKAATMLPIVFVLDVSKSMSSEDRITELNKGAKWFYKAMRTDEITRDCVEISIVTFGNEVVQKIKFSGIDDQAELFDKLSLEANGESTNIGSGMNLALDTIFKLKNEYSDAGLDYHQPWVVLITDCDGQGIDDYEIAAQKTSDVINQDRLVIFPIGVGTGDLKILKEFSPKRDPIKMKEKSFGQFFDWLKENALFISKSRPDEKAPLSSPSGWATL